MADKTYTSYSEWKRKHQAKKRYKTYGQLSYEKEKEKQFFDFFKKSVEYYKTSLEDFEDSGYSNASERLKSLEERSGYWKSASNRAKSYLVSNKDLFDEEQYKTLYDHFTNYSDALNEIGSAYRKNLDIYSKFSSEKAYNEAMKYGSMTEEELSNEIARLQSEYDNANPENYLDKTYGQSGYKRDRAKATDHVAVEGYKKRAELTPILEQAKAYYDQKVADREAKEKQKAANAMTNAALASRDYFNLVDARDQSTWDYVVYAIKGIEPPTPDYVKTERAYGAPANPKGSAENVWKNAVKEGKDIAAELSEYEKRAYMVYLNGEADGVYKKGTAKRYLETLNVNQRISKTSAENDALAAKDNPIFSSLYSIFGDTEEKMLSTITDVLSVFDESEIDPYDQLHRTAERGQNYRAVVSEGMGAIGRVAYNAVMSLADTALATGLGGGSGTIAGTILGLNAAGSTISNAKKRGVSDGQAVASGVAAGVFEMLFERISIDKLIDVAKTGRAGLRNIALDILKQMGTEGSEEVFTDLANAVADELINGKLSEANTSIQSYMAQGMSYEEAASKVAEDFGMQLVETFATGAVSGLGGSSLSTVGNALANRSVGTSLREGGLENRTLNLADTFNPDSMTGIRMKDYMNKAKGGKTPSASYLGAIYRGMAQDSAGNVRTSLQDAAKTKIAERMEAAGIKVSQNKVDAVLGTLMNTKLTTQQSLAMKNNDISTFADKIAEDPTFWDDIHADTNYLEAFEKESQRLEIERDAVSQEMQRVEIQGTQKAAKKTASKNISEEGKTLKDASVKEDGTVYFKEDGVEVSAEEAPLTRNAAEAISLSDGMSADKKRAFFTYLDNTTSNESLDKKHTAFSLAYDDGLYGYGIDEARAQTKGFLSDIELSAVYEAGEKAANSIKAKNEAEAKEIRSKLGIKEGRGGTFDDSKVRYAKLKYNDPRRVALGIGRIIAETTGRNVEMFDSTRKERIEVKENGRYEPDTNTLYIDVNAGVNEINGVLEAAMLPTLSHELVHVFAVENPAEFKKLADIVFRALTADGKTTRADLIAEEVKRIQETNPKRFKGKNKATREAIAEEEIVARACEDRLSNSKLMENFIAEMQAEDSVLAHKFKTALGRAIEKIINAIKYILGQRSYSNEAQKIANTAEDILTELQAQYDKLLMGSEQKAEAATSREAQKNTSDRGVMLQVRMLPDNKMYVQADRQVIRGDDSSLWEQQIIDYVSEEVRNGKDVVIPTIDGDSITINGRTAWKLGYRNGENEGRPISDELYKVKGTAAGHIDELGKVSAFKRSDHDKGGKHGEKASGGWNYRTAYFMDFDGKYYQLGISVIIDKDGKAFYNIGEIRERKPPKSLGSSVAISEADYNGARLGKLSYKDIVAHQEKSVNPQDKGSMTQSRDSYRSAREILTAYAKDAATVKERNGFLGEYMDRVETLDRKKGYLDSAAYDLSVAMDQGRKDSVKNLREKVNRLEREIKTLHNDLRTMEDSAELKAIVRREKEETAKRARKEAREEMRDYRTELERKSHVERIEAKVKLIAKKLAKNNREFHVPDALKEVLTDFVTSFDFTSLREYKLGKRSKKTQNMYALLDSVKIALEQNSAMKNGDYNILISPDVLDKIESLKETVEGYMNEEATKAIDLMPADKVRDLDFVMTGIVRALNSIDKAFGDSRKKTVYQTGEETATYLQGMKRKEKSDKGVIANVRSFGTWKNFTPYTTFKRFGDGGMRIYNNILRGWGEFAFRAKEVKEWANETWSPKEAKEWSNDVKEVELNGFKFKITDANLMYLYLLNQREQGIKHLDGDGFAVPEMKTKGKNGADLAKSEAIKSTKEQRDEFFDKYLPEGSRQREVANLIRDFMTNRCAEWGNEITMEIYGYRAFTDQYYVPIVMDESQLSVKSGETVTNGLYKVLNMGFTKSLNDNAKGEVSAVNLLEVFASHAADMAKYSTLGKPLLDAASWLNWRRYDEDENGEPVRTEVTMKSVMDSTYGEDAFNYVKAWLDDMNGVTKTERSDISRMVSKMTGAYKRAVVGSSLKVAALQPMSYTKAATVLSTASLTKAFKLLSQDEKGELLDEAKTYRYSKLAIQYSGMSCWKSLGYYDVNISRGLSDQIIQEGTVFDKATEKAMSLAAKMDELTLGKLFRACMIEVQSKSENAMTRTEILENAGELLDEVIVRTQVVDSTMTRSQLMRQKDTVSKVYTAFMSEATMSYNMLMDGIYDLLDKRRAGVKNVWKEHGSNLRRALAAYAMTGVITALLESLFEAYRDDDEDEDGFLMDMVKAIPGNLVDNLLPLKQIPLVSQLIDHIAQKILYPYSSQSSMEFEAIDAGFDVVKRGWKLFDSKGNTTKEIRDFIASILQTASYFTGTPFYNFARELENIWNNVGKWFDLDVNTKDKTKI